MKLEIELDLNKIDYSAINEQIQEKIKDIDLEKVYQINYKISRNISENVENIVKDHLCKRGWGNELNNSTSQLVREEIRYKIQEMVTPIVNNIFDKISFE